eukprot:378115-Amphidinium_carterae.1
MRRECAYFQLPDDMVIQHEKLVSALGGITKEVEDCCERAKNRMLKMKQAYMLACSKWQALILYHEFLENLGIPSPSQCVNIPAVLNEMQNPSGSISAMCPFGTCGEGTMLEELFLGCAASDGWEPGKGCAGKGKGKGKPSQYSSLKLVASEVRSEEVAHKPAGLLRLLSLSVAQAKQTTSSATLEAMTQVKSTAEDMVA